ncbi:MAG: aldehyde dehydrogenase family protein, partial [Pseudonocardia sp.]|nr:aldehyde dehydrogenase family protein [Pseudonocardia sp.]
MARHITHWINGKPWAGTADRTGDVSDPATGAVASVVDFADVATVDEAVASARAAFPGWRDTSLAKRVAVLFEFRRLLADRAADVAAAITAEHGKVLSDAAGEVQRGLEVVEFACGIPHLLKGGHTRAAATNVDVHEVHQPLGVAA